MKQSLVVVYKSKARSLSTFYENCARQPSNIIRNLRLASFLFKFIDKALAFQSNRCVLITLKKLNKHYISVVQHGRSSVVKNIIMTMIERLASTF